MASSAPPSDATKGLVLSLINDRLCALRKKRKRILQMESINKEREDVLRSKPSVLASIKELKKLRRQFSSALRDDDAPAALEKGEANNNGAANDGTAEGASSTHTSAEDQGMDISLGYHYEVFLSFAGSDTRSGFTDFLYTSLDGAGIRTFKDDKKLPIGEEFGPKLLQAIEESKFLIPIFSKGYASSVWCLKELAKMVEFQKVGRQKIIPIFYDVAPSEVRHQIRGYAKAFLSHEKKRRYGEETICQWKAALNAVGAINGWDLQDKTDRREGEFAKTVTDMIFSELRKADLVVSHFFVSVDNHVDAIMEMMGEGTSETRIIGIHGMGGIGKTTIAKIIYNQLSNNFKHCCFLSNTRETSERKGIQCLQRQLIFDILKQKCEDIKTVDDGIKAIQERLRTKKILLLLDDVDHKKHIDALVGKRNWFGTGSKLIITTRNKEVLKGSEVDDQYEVTGMDDAQSLQLFSKHAFKRDSPLDGYINQSKRAISIAGGLPLALKVIGSLLFNIKKEKWDGKLEELENIPPEDVQSKLKISYNALRFREKHIFLDIACLFIGYDKDIVIHFWDKSKFFPNEAMEVLQNLSLISIEKDNKVWMHDLLRDLGREIVLEESNLKIEKQSRVWDPKDGVDLLRRHKGQKEVEALCLKLDNQWQHRFTYEGFESLSYLRFLEVGGSMENFCAEARLLWHESTSNVSLANENSDLLPRLRWLSWQRIPRTFNITNFSMEDVVILDLSSSEITDDWMGWRHMEVMENLKVLDLSYCRRLKRTPNFSTHSNLERLILASCESLTEIDRSICHLKSLVSLDLRGCSELRRLPDELGRDLASLEYLSLAYCESLERLPDTIGNLESLIELDISVTGIKELPDSIGKLKNLKVAKMRSSNISKIPDAFWTIEKLEEIEVQFTGPSNVEVEIGNCICRNQSLRILKLASAAIYVVPRLPESLIILELSELYMDTFPDVSNLTNLKELTLSFSQHDDGGRISDGPVEEYPMPRWIGNLSKLETLHLYSCYFVTHLPEDISSLLPRLQVLTLRCPNLRCLPSLPSSLLSLDLESKYVTALSTDISGLLPRLQVLRLRCPNLRCLPSLPSSLLSLDLHSKHMTALPTDTSSLLPRLQTLHLWCPNLRCLPSLPSSLLNLDLRSEHVTALPMDFSSLLHRLQTLELRCPNLRCLPSLPSSLSALALEGCNSLGFPGDLSNLKNPSVDSVISEMRGLDGSENLDLQLSELQQVGMLPDLSYLNQLRYLHVSDCSNLVEIQDELPQCLKELSIEDCGSLRKLPDLSSLKGLRAVAIRRCGKLNVKKISSLCSKMEIEFWGDSYESEGEDDESGYELESGSEGED